MSNKCCSCGIDIPEGKHVCRNCFNKNDIVESFILEMRKNQTFKKAKKKRNHYRFKNKEVVHG